jgi:hypothetical protein
MKLRFEIDQAELFRKGIDAPKSVITIEVDPSKISAKDRNLIADRLNGIDVGTMIFLDGKTGKSSRRLVAETPDYAGLIEAVRTNQKEIEAVEKRHRAMLALREQATEALARANP